MKILGFLAAFLVAISILVAVHEFGHYWVAKKLGFKVLRFSIGFGKPLLTRIGRDPDRTEYCLSAIPLGGYVKLLDEREGDVAAAELPRSFTRRPIVHRIAVLLAGPAMNLLFAALLYAILAMAGTEIVKPVVGQVRSDGPAALAGLKAGDQIISVGDRKVADTEELQIALIRQFTGEGVVPLRVLRDGSTRALTLRVTDDKRALTEPGRLLPGLGFDLATWHADTLVHAAPADSAGGRAGLRAGDRLLAVDGQHIINSRDFVAVISDAPGRVITIDVQRGAERLAIEASVPRVIDQGRAIGRLGITLDEGPQVWPPGLVEMHRAGPVDAVVSGVAKTWEMSALTVQMLWRMLTGQVSPKNISGVVSIAEFAGISAYLGLTAYMAFLAIISVSLGVLNLMPVPLLDGGQIVYQAVEAVKGSPISERAQLFGQQVGIALLVLLMSLAFYNDISRHLN
ncbi:MAG TPA: RIP metalloprotease RseP [Steroidobacteraceae bacterium]|jgi:regulator of sigma E protease|nr:RIP metalloprotease RseP [Steroidobacteraceae bacterium]HXC20361.1 RIP metalloprotease RseP [Steroidobacteraceae bacterium]